MNGSRIARGLALAGLLLGASIPAEAGRGTTAPAEARNGGDVERIVARYDAYRFPDLLCGGAPALEGPQDLALVYSGGRVLLQMTDRQTRRGVRIPAQATVQVMAETADAPSDRWVAVRSSCETGSLEFAHGGFTATFPISSLVDGPVAH